MKNLRLTDIVGRGDRGDVKLLSVRLPGGLLARIDALGAQLGSRKAETVVALLNEGLDRFDAEETQRLLRRPVRRPRRRAPETEPTEPPPFLSQGHGAELL